MFRDKRTGPRRQPQRGPLRSSIEVPTRIQRPLLSCMHPAVKALVVNVFGFGFLWVHRTHHSLRALSLLVAVEESVSRRLDVSPARERVTAFARVRRRHSCCFRIYATTYVCICMYSFSQSERSVICYLQQQCSSSGYLWVNSRDGMSIL